MSTVRVLVGTHKGAFILTSDGKRKDWKVDGPHFAGWEIYHMKGSPVDPEQHLRIADQRVVWPVAAVLHDGGKTWERPGVKPAEAPRPWPPSQEQPVCVRHFRPRPASR